MYLFVVDNSNHRILQLHYVPSNSTGTAAANPPTGTAVATPAQGQGGAAVASPLQYTSQYVSSNFSAVKSIVIASNEELSLLTQTNENSLGQVSINLTRTCASTS
jgi:hypothetical protein